MDKTSTFFSTVIQNAVDDLPLFSRTLGRFFMDSTTPTSENVRLPRSPQEMMESLVEALCHYRERVQYITFVFNGNDKLSPMYAAAANITYFNSATKEFAQSMLAIYSDKPTVVPHHRVNVSSMQVDYDTDTGSRYNISEGVYDPTGPYVNIALPWYENGSTVRWFTTTAENDSIYFKYIVPFTISGALGYFTYGLHSETTMVQARNGLDSLGKNGIMAMFDAKQGIIVRNTFNQLSIVPYVTPDGDVRYKQLFINESQNVYFNSFVENVESNGGFESAMGNQTEFRVTLRVQDEDVMYRMRRITDEYGCNLLIVVGLLKSDFNADILRSRYTGIGVGVGMVVLGIIAAVLIALWVNRPTQRLVSDLERVARLDFHEGDVKTGFWRQLFDGDFIPEIQELRSAFSSLMRSLQEMRTFIPAAVMNAAAEQAAGRVNPHSPMRELVVTKEVNVLTPTLCSVVAVEAKGDIPSEEVEEILKSIGRTAERLNGSIDVLSHSVAYISFGAHNLVASHTSQAALFVKAVMDDIRGRFPATHQLLQYFIHCTEFSVGTCGTSKNRTRVVAQTTEMEDYMRVAWDIGCQFATTVTPNAFTDVVT
ncbi:serine/threonine protein kinase, partial [Angomonas deanei]